MNSRTALLTKDPMLQLDLPALRVHLSEFLRDQLRQAPRHGGYVVGISGGIDSAVAAALCVDAVGAEQVHAVLLPERESQLEGVALAGQLVEHLDISSELFDLSATLDSLGVYEEREAVVRDLFPDFGPDWRYRLVLPGNLQESHTLNVYRLEVIRPDGSVQSARPDLDSLRQLQAWTNVKQRVRMSCLYREAESRGYLVCGTTNRSELSLGFFVRHGDGGVDVEPLAELYKTQVRALASHLGLPLNLIEQEPSPDTWSAPVSDREFYMRIGYEELDQILVRVHRGQDSEEISRQLQLDAEFVERVRSDLDRKRRATLRHRTLPPTPATDEGGA